MSSSKKSSNLARRARANVALIFTQALEQELLLSSTTRQFYINFPAFHSLHKLFADQYRQLEQWLDQLAQRKWSMSSAGKVSVPTVTNTPAVPRPEPVPEQAMIGELLSRHEELAKKLQEDVRICAGEFGDPGAAEILRRLVEFHETTAWMLRTVLAGSAQTPANGR
jgi:starvation-inducible DNA-binding protein